jgi:uncharacterized protein (DUF305 family)
MAMTAFLLQHMENRSMSKMHYSRLAVMAALSFAAMYVLMYAMVERFANVHPNLNQAYMAGLMTAPMILIRQQTAISDKQFLKSMIPHHGELCRGIIASQQSEMDWMKAGLKELEG